GKKERKKGEREEGGKRERRKKGKRGRKGRRRGKGRKGGKVREGKEEEIEERVSEIQSDQRQREGVEMRREY
ncbi:hypothetical protein ACQJ1P_26890, partial [Klebsiella pneumoniae]|uniref:hypothetical protein n=1 Tax=Klebsiella pneumoniae TaxID=573 RepID=UPI003D079667